MASPEELGWRLPVQSTSPPDVVRWLTDLATDVAAALDAAGLAGRRVESRSAVVTANANGVVTVVLAVPFGSPPTVVWCLGDVSGVDLAKRQTLGSVTVSSFDVGGFRPGESVRINFVAIGAQ